MPATVRVQQPFTARIVVVNRSRQRAGRVEMKVVLSRDDQVDTRDARVATVDVPALRAGARRTFEVRVTARRTGEQRLIACIRKRCRNAVLVVKAAVGQDPAAAPPAGNPLDVSPVLDTASAESARIAAADGGTITATGADGSTFVLVVPPDGLLGDETITLTPVASLGGKPFAGAMSAVDLKPHGLQLGRLATLTITPPATIPLSQQLVFATRQAGKDFHAYPPTQDPTAIALQLSHFSVKGVGAATNTERAAVALRTPADAQAQLEKAIGEQAQEMKRNGNFDGELLVPDVLEYYRTVVKPRLDAATSDDSLAVLASASFLSWERQAQLLAIEDAVATQIANGRALLLEVMEFAFTRSYDRCMNGETAYLSVMLAMERTLTLLGLPIDGQALTWFLECARFELDFDARVEHHTQDLRSGSQNEEDWELTVEAHDVPLLTAYDEDNVLKTAGTLPLVVTDWRYANSASYAGDWAAGNTEVVAPLAVEANLPLSYRLETASDGRTRYVLVRGRPSVDIDPGKINLFYTKGGTFQYPSIWPWESLFQFVWAPERLPDPPRHYRFNAFFDALPPKLGLFLEERPVHRETDDFITDDFGRLRMEIEHAPKP